MIVSRNDWCKGNALLGGLLEAQAPALFQRCQKSPNNNAVQLLRLLLLLAMHFSRWTVWRKLRELESYGLVAATNHYDSLDGLTAISGKIWTVRLKPGRAKIAHEDLAHNWRNLENVRIKPMQGAPFWLFLASDTAIGSGL